MARVGLEHEWYELHVPAAAAVREPVVALLAEAGTAGCQEFDDRVVAYFKGVPPRRLTPSLRRLMRRLGLPLPPGRLYIRKISNQNWAETWKTFVGPVQVSPRLLICPTWSPAPSPTDGIVIYLDPGMAFGSGHHATTRAMLLLLEEYVIPRGTLLDVGTGSGILAIAARKLGARPVFACDIDPQAVPIAKENAQRNQVCGELHFWVGTVDACPRARFDLIAANITTQALSPLLPGLKGLLLPEGVLLLAGILDREEEAFVHALAAEGLCVRRRLQIEEWVSFVVAHC